MIYRISGWTMIGRVMGFPVRGHSHYSIIEIIVPDEEESRTLASLRDGLSLPKLMKGEVRVKS